MEMAHLDKANRVRNTLVGAPTDRPPISFWVHNFARENSAQELAEETVRQFRIYDWDLIKVQSRASVFSEGWGTVYRRSSEVAVPPTLIEWPIHSATDLQELRPLDPTVGPLGEQLEALRQIRQQLDRDIPIIQTIFAPAMVLSYLVGRSVDTMLEYVRAYPAETHSALAAIRDTLMSYAQACLANGSDGIFLAIKAAGAGEMTREEYTEFGLPYDRAILDAARGGWLNTIHLCGAHLYFDVVNDLPSSLISWALEPGNPRLAAGRERGKRAVMGGVSPKPRIREMAPEDVAVEVCAALDDTDGVRVIIGPGCSISPDTPQINLHAARSALERWSHERRG